MNIIGIEIEWHERYSNDPTFVVELDAPLPPYDAIVHERIGDCVYGESDGRVDYFYHNGDGKNHGGFGGRIYRVPIFDRRSGSVSMMDFGGPWSGGASDVNQVAPQYVVDVSYKTPKYKHCNIAGAITLDRLLLAAVDMIGLDYWVYADLSRGPERPLFTPYHMDKGPKNPRPTDNVRMLDYYCMRRDPITDVKTPSTMTDTVQSSISGGW